MISPINIIMLLKIHCFSFEEQMTMMNGSPGSHAAFDWLTIHELIEHDADKSFPYKTTPRGDALVKKFREIQLPVLEEKWV